MATEIWPASVSRCAATGAAVASFARSVASACAARRNGSSALWPRLPVSTASAACVMKDSKPSLAARDRLCRSTLLSTAAVRRRSETVWYISTSVNGAMMITNCAKIRSLNSFTFTIDTAPPRAPNQLRHVKPAVALLSTRCATGRQSAAGLARRSCSSAMSRRSCRVPSSAPLRRRGRVSATQSVPRQAPLSISSGAPA